MALVLTRKPDESIIINGNIRIKVYKEDGMMKLFIEAPKEVSIVREELLHKKE